MNPHLQSVCVFCGSSSGNDPAFTVAAVQLATVLADRGSRVVYGGAHVGLMGTVADTALAAGAEVIGVIPHAMVEREVAHGGLTDLRVVGSIHERKALLSSLSEGFVTLPGGMGTLEELTEILSWSQLGIHAKPVGLLNVNGYFDDLLSFLDQAVVAGFLRSHHRDLLVVRDDAASLLDEMAARNRR